MVSRARSIALACFATLLTTAGHAHADEGGGATAEALFQRGKAALAAGDTAAACAYLEESFRLDKAGGTLQNLAFCYETLGRFASAYSRYEDLRAMARSSTPPRPDRVQLAEEHIKKLAPMLTRLFVRASPNELVKGLTLSVDGIQYGEVAWTAGIVLDPGTHSVEVRAPAKLAFRKEVTLSERGDETLVLPHLEDDRSRVPDPHPTRKIGVIVGASGATIGVTGAVFAVLAATTKSDCKGVGPDYDPTTRKCYADTPSWRTARSDQDRANTFANIANVAVPVGLVGLGVGAFLFFRGPSEKTTATLRLEPSPFGGRIVGEF